MPFYVLSPLKYRGKSTFLEKEEYSVLTWYKIVPLKSIFSGLPPPPFKVRPNILPIPNDQKVTYFLKFMSKIS